MKKKLTTPHLDIQSTTDLKLAKEEIQFDIMKNTRGIAHVHVWRKYKIFRQVWLNHSGVGEWRLWHLEPWCYTIFILAGLIFFHPYPFYFAVHVLHQVDGWLLSNMSFFSSANEVSTGPTCQFLCVCLSVCVSGLFFKASNCMIYWHLTVVLATYLSD